MKKLIITETDKDYIKSLYGLLNEQNSKPPIEVKLISEEHFMLNGPGLSQGFNRLEFYTQNNILLSFKIVGENYEFSEDFNIYGKVSSHFYIKDVNSTTSNVIVSLLYIPEERRYRLAVRRDKNFQLEIRQKNSENKTPFILPVKNTKGVFEYNVSLVGVKNIEYKYRKLKPNEQPQIDFPFDREVFLKIPEIELKSGGYETNQKILVIIESPIEILNMDLAQQRLLEGKDFIKKDNKVFIGTYPINNNNLTLFTPNQRIIIKYNEILPNETNYFVLEPIKK